MADGHFPTLVSKNRDVNALANPMLIELSDGSAALHKVIDDAAGGTDAGVAALVVRDDVLTTLNPADGDYTSLRVDANGALWVTLTTAGNSNIKADDSAFTIATDYVGVAGFLADETTPDSVNEGDIGAARMTLDRKQLMVLVDPTTDTQRLAIDSDGKIGVNSIPTVTVTATALDIRALTLAADAVKVSANSTANGITNPIYVQVVTTGIQTTEIHSYDTTADVASDTGDNHDYTVTGSTFLLKSVIFAASGGIKVTVQTGPVASLVTKAVAFIPKEGGFGQIFFDPPIEVPVASTGTVRVIRTNRQGQAQDVYSSIIGNDVP